MAIRTIKSGKLPGPKRIITGEEGHIFELSEPLDFSGSEMVKEFHQNYGRIFYDCNGELIPMRRERFLFSTATHGFHRLYEIYRLGHTLFPENVAEVRTFRPPPVARPNADGIIPPLLFNSEHPPLDENGQVGFPRFGMKKVEMPPEDFAQLRRMYGTMFAVRNEFLRNPNAPNSDELIERFKSAIRECERYMMDKYEGPMWMAGAYLCEAGFTLTHPEVNFTFSNGRIVFFELNCVLNHDALGQYIRGVPHANTRRRAGTHFGLLLGYEERCLEQLIQWNDAGIVGMNSEQGIIPFPPDFENILAWEFPVPKPRWVSVLPDYLIDIDGGHLRKWLDVTRETRDEFSDIIPRNVESKIRGRRQQSS